MKLAELHQERPIAFGLHLAIVPEAYVGPDQAAVAFGLKPLGGHWREVDRSTAEAVLVALLREDMAFSSPRLESEVVRQVIDEFLNPFSPSTRYFTNGDWDQGWRPSRFGSVAFGPQHMPATDATFDGGIIALNGICSGVLWLEDED